MLFSYVQPSTTAPKILVPVWHSAADQGSVTVIMIEFFPLENNYAENWVSA